MDFYYEWIGYTVRKVDGSSQEDENLKSKMDGYKTSPQSGWIIPRGWKFEVQNEQVHKVDGSSQEDENWKSKNWTDHPRRATITAHE